VKSEMNAYEIQAEAYRAFERWCAEHDPAGKLDMLEAAAAYSEWASRNSIEPYLDRPSRSTRGGENG